MRGVEETRGRPSHDVCAVLFVGPHREWAQDCLTALCEQEGADRLSIVVVEEGPSPSPPLVSTGPAQVTHIASDEDASLGRTRASALASSDAPVAAFLTARARPAPGWLRAVVVGFEDPDLAVATYSFLPDDSGRYFARAYHVMDFGTLRPPGSAVSTLALPWDNYVVSRAFLASIDLPLERQLDHDTTLFQLVRDVGAPYVQLDDAVVFYRASERVAEIVRTTIEGFRSTARERVRTEGWPWPRRIVYAFAVPAVYPVLRIQRLVRHYLTIPRHGWELIVSLPFISFLLYLGSVSEGIAYLLPSD